MTGPATYPPVPTQMSGPNSRMILFASVLAVKTWTAAAAFLRTFFQLSRRWKPETTMPRNS